MDESHAASSTEPGPARALCGHPDEILAAARMYSAIFDAATDGAWVHNVDGTILVVNEAYCRMSGYCRGELIGMHIGAVEANESPDDIAAHIRQLRQTGGRDRFETRHRRKDGSTYDVDVTAFCLDADGGMIATFVRDIGERKRAEAALRESEQKFAAVFHASPVPMSLAELPAGALSDVNQAWLDIVGCACREDVLGKTTVQLGLVPDPEARQRLFGQFERAGVVRNADLRIRTLAGELRDVLISVDRMEIGGKAFALTTNLDVTDRKRAEEALRKSEEEYRHLVQYAPTGIYEIDYDGPRFRRVNDAMCHILGYTREELLAMNPFDLLDAQSRARFADRVRRVTAGEPIDDSVAYRVLGKDGREIWGALNLKLLYSEGKLDGALVVAHDITQLKRAQDAVRDLNARLRRSMRETHHRVKNNLQVIAALIDMLRMSDRDTVPVDEVARLVRHVRGLASIHDLLTQDAHVNGNAEVLSVRGALGKLKPLLDEMCVGRELQFAVDDAALPVRQSTALVVLVNELVSNAVKHGEAAIELSFTVTADRASLQVRDHGPGFPAGFDASAAARTGLELVQNLGSWDLQGEVEFANAPDGGACVAVRFPVSSPPGP